MRVLTGNEGREALRVILNPAAFRIVCLLGRAAMNVQQLAAKMGSQPTAIYRELEKLRRVEAVTRSVQPELAASGRPCYRFALAIDGVDTDLITLVLSEDYLAKFRLGPSSWKGKLTIPPPPDGYTGLQAVKAMKLLRNSLNRRILQELVGAPTYARNLSERLDVHESVIVRRLRRLRDLGFLEPVGGLSKQGRPAKAYILRGGAGTRLVLVREGLAQLREVALFIKKGKESR